MLNRLIVPQPQPISFVPFPEYEKVFLESGVVLYLLPYGLQPVMGLEFIFNGGKCSQKLIGQANFTSEMISEGTHTRSAYQVALELDSYGAYLSAETSIDFSSVSLHVLDRFFEPAFEVFSDVLKNPAFSENEFQSKYERTLQNIEVEEQKTGWQARRLFTDSLYGKFHPYAATLNKEELKLLTVDKLKEFYKQYIRFNECTVIAAGKFDRNRLIDNLNLFFGTQKGADLKFTDIPESISPQIGQVIHEMSDNMQSTIRVGHRGVERTHVDVYKMRVTNTILGGYFGSRLMSNIREDKGYTYGIGSAWLSFRNGGYFMIGADVGSEFVEDTLVQIRIELEKLRQEKVSENELQIVKNYMTGKLASESETPFQLAERLKHALVFGFGSDEINKAFTVINEVTSEDVLTTAQKYFKPEELLEVICGK